MKRKKFKITLVRESQADWLELNELDSFKAYLNSQK